MADAIAGSLPPKLYFRIGEVAELVGVEPHVLRYWEREFRNIRPTKSAKGQRVYSRRDVENLMRVRELLYKDGFTIAGAKKRLLRGPADALHDEAGDTDPPPSQTLPPPALRAQSIPPAPSEPATEAPPHTYLTRDELLAVRSEIETFLAELDHPHT